MSLSNPENRAYFDIDPRQIDFPNLDQLVMTARVIVVALVTGLVLFTGLTLFDLEGFDWQPSVLTWIGWATILAAIPLSMVVPTSVVTAQIRTAILLEGSSPPGPALFEKFSGFFVAKLILECAMLEGTGFLNAIAFRLDKNPLSLVAVAVCIALIAAKFPSKWQLQSWIAARLRA